MYIIKISMESMKMNVECVQDQETACKIAEECIMKNDVTSLIKALENINEVKLKHRMLAKAVQYKNYACMTALMDSGADPFESVEETLDQAVRNNDPTALNILTRDLRNQQNGASNVEENRSHASCDSETKSTRLHSLEERLKGGKKASLLGTVLLHAIKFNRIECVKVLLECNINLSSAFKNTDDDKLLYATPLMIACYVQNSVSESPCIDGSSKSLISRRLDIAELLLDKGHVDVNVANYAGVTALMCAAECGAESCVKLLINYGADVRSVSKAGRTALMHCIINKPQTMVEVSRMLIDAGTDVNVFDMAGWSALDAAIDSGNVDLVELLLSRGAITDTTNTQLNPNATRRSNPMDGPLFAATTLGNIEMVKVLLQWGVDVNYAPPPPTSKRSGGLILTRIGIRHAQASTPFRYALEIGNYKLGRLLLAAGYCRIRAQQTVESMLMEMSSGLFTSMLSYDIRTKQKALEDIHDDVIRVQSLKQFCRLRIRKTLNNMQQINELPLPQSIISYLWMKDL